VDVWKDNWIPRASAQHPLGIQPGKEAKTVSEFLLPEGRGGGWNEEKLRDTFFESDVTDILSLPVGRAGTEDYIGWNNTKNDIFSVKLVYHLCGQLK
jgi:hypothetical protein